MSVHLMFETGRAVLLDTGDGAPRLSGTALPFGEVSGPSISTGDRYRFSSGPDNEVIGALAVREHDEFTPIGRVAKADLGEKGIDIVVDLIDTTAGRDSHAEGRAGLRNGFSIAFDPVETETGDDGVVDVRRWNLRHIGHVMRPAFGDLTTAVAASTEEGGMPETQTTTETPDVRLMERMDQLEARLTAPAPAPAPALSVREAFALQLRESRGKGALLALADVISSGNSGLLPPQWSSEVRNTFDSFRYMIPRLGAMAFPTVGHTLTIPKVTQQTLVAARGTEKSDIPSRALTTGQDTYTATWYAGGVDVGLEVVSQSDPAILNLVVENLLQQYAAVTDTAVTLAMETNGTATGSALDFTSYKTFVDKIMVTAEAIRVATGSPGDRLSLTPASWQKLIGLVDAQGRRILSTTGAANADGSAGLTSTSVDVGGILCFFNARATKDLQFNTVAARVAEKPPLQISAINVGKAGQDIGVLGAVMDLPLFPAGIKRHAATTAREAKEK